MAQQQITIFEYILMTVFQSDLQYFTINTQKMKDKVCHSDSTSGSSQTRSKAYQFINSSKYTNQTMVAIWNQENVISTGAYVSEDKGEKIIYSRMSSSHQLNHTVVQGEQQAKQDQLNLKREDLTLMLQNLVEELSPLNILEACEYLFRKLREVCHRHQVLVATSRAQFRMEAITNQSCICIQLQMKCYLEDDCEAIILIF